MKIFIGWDSRETEAYKVCEYSLRKHSSTPLDIVPLKRDELTYQGIYKRPLDEKVSTEFTFTRFLVPYLQNYKGWAMFVDCDFLFTRDVNELFQYTKDEYGVVVVKHDYVPKQSTKMDGQAQVSYPRKNWSSLILWNCQHPGNKVLGTQTVGISTPSYLHRFSWLEDNEIGSLPLEWNFLIGEYNKLPAALHFTNGGPWFDNCKDVDYADLWTNTLKELQ